MILVLYEPASLWFGVFFFLSFFFSHHLFSVVRQVWNYIAVHIEQQSTAEYCEMDETFKMSDDREGEEPIGIYLI